jgi:hypothetical protein
MSNDKMTFEMTLDEAALIGRALMRYANSINENKKVEVLELDFRLMTQRRKSAGWGA